MNLTRRAFGARALGVLGGAAALLTAGLPALEDDTAPALTIGTDAGPAFVGFTQEVGVGPTAMQLETLLASDEEMPSNMVPDTLALLSRSGQVDVPLRHVFTDGEEWFVQLRWATFKFADGVITRLK